MRANAIESIRIQINFLARGTRISIMARSPKDNARRRSANSGTQVAALPFRLGETVEVLLVTSRETRRWVIPKGWPMRGKRPYAAAAREAFEEAGVLGPIARSPIGAYDYVKRLKNGAPLACRVEVFPMRVSHQRARWPEQGQRTGHWFKLTEAAAAVDEPDLSELILAFEAEAPRIAAGLPARRRGKPKVPRASAGTP
jgi:8-oxo-dGTP pyrophosphatase MutT (NUDIX family)